MKWASDEHKLRYLSPLAAGEEIWCQLFSEPAAGSDLAGLRTRAATLGDPLLDFGRLLAGWPDGGQPQPYTMRVERYDGFPTREELIIRYAERTGRDLVHLPWFETLSCYKIGIILEGSYARAQAGLADATTGQRLHLSAVALLERARSVIDRC